MDEKERTEMVRLLKRHPEDEWMIEIVEEKYGTKTVTMVEGGSVDFDPDGWKTVVHGEKLSYIEYVDAQIRSVGQTHSGFQQCFYNIPSRFKGQIEKISKTGRVCFRRIYISGMYPDGECFEGKEDHVWMEQKGFDGLNVGDCVSFFAEPYRYLKTGDGKKIDYGIRNPQAVRKIESYELPSDDELLDQSIDSLACEACFLYDTCSREICTNSKWRRKIKKDIKSSFKKAGEID